MLPLFKTGAYTVNLDIGNDQSNPTRVLLRQQFLQSDLGQVVSLLCICLSTFQMLLDWAVRIKWDVTGAAALGEKPSAVHTYSGLQFLFLM